ncbi:MAG: hypothetical protein MHM6MM_002889 [Cercozoa sp. M6MM]
MFGHDDRRSPWHRRSICERMWRRREVRIGTLIFSIVFLLYLLSSSSQNAPKLIERDQREPSYDPGHDNSHFADRPGAVADADFADDGGVTQEDGVTAAEDGATGEEDGVLGEVPAVLTRDKVVLVTGAAGFIGMSTAYALSKRSDVKRVVGVDNFNAYYSPALKMARADHLRQHTGAEVVNGDVCDQSLMTDLLVSYGVTHVVHLAAQAGVRYSTQNPASYVRANVDCFVTLLDAIAAVTTSARKQEEIAAAPIRLVYASSSSVYGGNKKVPFAESDLVNRPVSLYAASKKADELIAHTYSHLHDICMIGLRFFTVYGPWGRPDMAVLKFAALMSQDKFSDSNAAEFASSCVDVLNLGDSTPVSLMDFVRTLEDVMDTTARIEYKPAAPGDVKRTHASIARSRSVLGYQPTTPLRAGLEHFSQWFQRHFRPEFLWTTMQQTRAPVALPMPVSKQTTVFLCGSDDQENSGWPSELVALPLSQAFGHARFLARRTARDHALRPGDVVEADGILVVRVGESAGLLQHEQMPVLVANVSIAAVTDEQDQDEVVPDETTPSETVPSETVPSETVPQQKEGQAEEQGQGAEEEELEEEEHETPVSTAPAVSGMRSPAEVCAFLQSLVAVSPSDMPSALPCASAGITGSSCLNVDPNTGLPRRIATADEVQT